MLNPHRLNGFAGIIMNPPNYPLSWVKVGALYVALSWQLRQLNSEQELSSQKWKLDLDIPIAFPATYQDQRMIAQRSCFTIHGTCLEPMHKILTNKGIDVTHCVVEYEIDYSAIDNLMSELSMLGISAATIFPDLDHLVQDIVKDVKK